MEENPMGTAWQHNFTEELFLLASRAHDSLLQWMTQHFKPFAEPVSIRKGHCRFKSITDPRKPD
jgi:hypothetical protein